MISEKKVTDFPCRQLLSVSPYKYPQCFPTHPTIVPEQPPPPSSVTNLKWFNNTFDLPADTVSTFSGSLYIKGDKRSIVAGCQTCSFTNDASWCFLVAADTCQKSLMTDSHTGNHFILHFSFPPVKPPLLKPVHVIGEYFPF